MDYRALIQGEFIKATDFGVGDVPAQPTWTMNRIAIEKLESMKAGDNEDDAPKKKKNKGIIFFAEYERGWVTNSTNLQCIAGMFGNETESWLGKRITMFSTPVRVGKTMEPGIRLVGSPDIDKEIVVMVKLPRRKPIPMKMQATGRKQATPVPQARIVDLTAEGFAAARIGDNEAERSQSLAEWWKGLTAAEKGAMKPVLDDELKPLAVKGPKVAGAPDDPAEHF